MSYLYLATASFAGSLFGTIFCLRRVARHLKQSLAMDTEIEKINITVVMRDA